VVLVITQHNLPEPSTDFGHAIMRSALKLNLDGFEFRNHSLFRSDPPYGEGSALVALPAIEAEKIPWYGWHAFRRGLATNLHRLRVSDKVIQQILRHANVTTTINIYVKMVSRDAEEAMKKLESNCSLVRVFYSLYLLSFFLAPLPSILRLSN
jgi:hypothetical protein